MRLKSILNRYYQSINFKTILNTTAMGYKYKWYSNTLQDYLLVQRML